MLDCVVGSIKDLPIMPRTYLSLRERMADPEISVKDVIVLVEKNVGISAKILQLVNPALFGLPREISTVRTAVSFLGIEMVHNLVLSAEVFRLREDRAAARILLRRASVSFAPDRQNRGPNYRFGADSLGGDCCSVASRCRQTCGGHARGEAFRPRFGGSKGSSAFSGGRRAEGVTHAEVGTYLLSLWGLPCQVVEAVAHHHQPRRVPQDSLDAVGILHIANFLAHEHAMRHASAKGCAYQPLDEAYVESLDVKEQIAAWNEMAEAPQMKFEIRAAH
jgi:HD-like signal output (HDOD) protein